jgi:peptide/nickel transport system ATP-binding protein
MIVITHDISVLFQVADTILVMYAGHLAEKAPAKTIISDPLHPYTKMLIGALPKVGDRYEEQQLEGIEGRPPSLLEPPAGCRFRARCPLAHDRCAEAPPFREVALGHHVACWAVS